MKKETNKYFGEKEEQAVIEYIITNSSEKKHFIYNKILKKPFLKMVSSILRRYNNHIGNYNIKDVEADGLSRLVETMIKYRPFIIQYKYIDDETNKWISHKTYRYLYEDEMLNKLNELNLEGSKILEYRAFYASAYSYCGTIVRNYFKDHSINSRKEIVNKTDLESEELNFDENIKFSYEVNYFDDEDNDISYKLFIRLTEQIENVLKSNNKLTDNEIIVGKGIHAIFSNWELLFRENTEFGNYDKVITNNFNNTKIFFLLKEYTRMDLKEIRKAMKPYKNIFMKTKKDILEENLL